MQRDIERKTTACNLNFGKFWQAIFTFTFKDG